MKQVSARQRRHWMRPVSEKTGGSVRRLNVKLYYSQDGLGSVRTLTDASGVVQNWYDYAAFGEPYAPGTSVSVSQRYTYTGREHSSLSGLNYHRYRWDDPRSGRFTTRDPIGYRGGINVYQYAEGRVTKFADPYGRRKYATPPRTTICKYFAGNYAGKQYLVINGKCYSASCVIGVCDDAVECYICAGATGAANEALCLAGCTVGGIWGWPGYKACVALCSAMSLGAFAIDCATCDSAYERAFRDCEVDMKYCKCEEERDRY